MENWRKSSYSGDGDGDNCVEIANAPAHIAIRDSKAPASRTLTFPKEAFAPFLATVRNYSTVTDFARFRG
ncbi:DUF397 domain-containing protein [Streptomyces sp. ADMS]|uniref:DUF397 domain-containing protein n=1 Tax=Streptomyces sp. ADMS TaxID=3071415 RepID=UPI00296FB793|nr:DUF397 domain-containing protein [Streptomyces sp. ADMS]MDW4904921.1 DUF397 domain-containing protein [Streptomyces sp. ADMS]